MTQRTTPPRAPPGTDTHDTSRTDLRGQLPLDADKSSPELVGYLQDENALRSLRDGPTEPLQKKLYAEMLSHIKETDVSVPYRDRGWFYYVRTVEGSQYPIHCRTTCDRREVR